jgi:hypothetical protein
MSRPRKDTDAGAQARSVYSGRDRLGSIIEREDGFEARDRQGKSIGRFENASEATAAIVRRAVAEGA